MIHKLTMPKWGLSMTEGKVVAWLAEDGAEVDAGAEVVEIETEKIASGLEVPRPGILRQVSKIGEMAPVGALIGVIVDAGDSQAEIDAFVAEFQASFVPEEAEEESPSAEPETIEVLGKTMRYLKRGEGGDPAILFHGFGGDLNNWLFNHEALAANRAVYAVDRPGHGGSSKDVGSATPDSFKDTLEGVMDALDLPKAHLVGHSMGGGVSLDFALAHPERMLSLVLIASTGLGPEIDGGYIDGFVTASKRRDLKPHLEKLFADPKQVTRQLIDDVLKYKRLDGVDLALRTIADQFFPEGQQVLILRDRLSELSVPTLVLWGAEDRIVPVSHAEGLPANIETRIIPGAGHMVQMEAAAEVNRAITSFWG